MQSKKKLGAPFSSNFFCALKQRKIRNGYGVLSKLLHTLIILTIQTTQFLLPIQGSHSEVNGTRLLLQFLSCLTRQLRQCYELLLK